MENTKKTTEEKKRIMNKAIKQINGYWIENTKNTTKTEEKKRKIKKTIKQLSGDLN